MLRWLVCAVLAVSITAGPVLAADTIFGVTTKSEFEQKYERLTLRLLLLGLDFEQYSLNYRMEALRDHKGKRTLYFLGQETAAAGAMTAAIMGTNQAYSALYAPQRVAVSTLHNLQRVGEVTSIIGASSSAVELGANGYHALHDKVKHQDRKTATKYLIAELNQIDQLLAQRKALLASNPDLETNRARAAQYKAETDLLDTMRDTIVEEHKKFEVTKVGFRTQENVFYALNIGTSIISVLQYDYGWRGIRHSRSTGPSNIHSTISAAMVMANPVIASLASRLAKRRARKQLDREFGIVRKPPSVDELKGSVAELQRTSTLTKDDPASQRTASAILDAYGVVNQIFPRELESEIAMLHTLDQVAVQNVVMSQPIGACALTSGITGIRGFYRYPAGSRRAGRENLASGVSGLVGASIATGATGLGYVFETWNRQQLKKRGKLPEQLMEERIKASKQVTARLRNTLPVDFIPDKQSKN